MESSGRALVPDAEHWGFMVGYFSRPSSQQLAVLPLVAESLHFGQQHPLQV
jgi:hypothetical protein